MFALAAAGQLEALLESAGFTDVIVESVELGRAYESVDAFLEETLDLSRMFGDTMASLSEEERREVRAKIESLAEPYADADGALSLPGRSLVAAANA
jgi:hypothetical protein